MEYIIKEFNGICPKTNQERIIKVAYFKTFGLSHGYYMERSHSLCKCSLDCPIYKETPEIIKGI